PKRAAPHADAHGSSIYGHYFVFLSGRGSFLFPVYSGSFVCAGDFLYALLQAHSSLDPACLLAQENWIAEGLVYRRRSLAQAAQRNLERSAGIPVGGETDGWKRF